MRAGGGDRSGHRARAEAAAGREEGKERGRKAMQPGVDERRGRCAAGRAGAEAAWGGAASGLGGKGTRRGGGEAGSASVRRGEGSLLPARLTEEAAAKPVPHAAHGVPDPAVPQAGHEGKGDPEEGHQQVAEADVDQQEVGGGAQPLELVVEDEHQQVVADAQ